MAGWVEAIKRASTLYEEIFYAAIVREGEGASPPCEHCFPHWSDQHKVFRNLVKEALHRRKYGHRSHHAAIATSLIDHDTHTPTHT